ncbi:hypothetical protein CY34DRAFT_19422 [Suillus luteus UH-Slu-Lm8-n1]|uniref:Uncharacterized protein n=1 Tax=Suillus luteus UH-Slu-Lm8-n1 TaxID=930992 RepID=A0A0D0A1C4_9AGAM|nr:hypothetical protein CY34DRAFT_19422 [Suillus luteus UH-Slu-Lm8-n1]
MSSGSNCIARGTNATTSRAWVSQSTLHLRSNYKELTPNILGCSASLDNTIKLWAFESRQLLASFHVQLIHKLVLSPDSCQLAYTTVANDDDHNIHICDTPPKVLAQAPSVHILPKRVLFVCYYITHTTSLPGGNAFFNPTHSSSAKGKQKMRVPKRRPIKFANVPLGQATYADALVPEKGEEAKPQPVYDDEFDGDDEETVPAPVAVPRVQHEEIELKTFAAQAQPEAGLSRPAVTDHVEA